MLKKECTYTIRKRKGENEKGASSSLFLFKMSKEDYFEVEGEVVDALPNAIFRVQLDPPMDQNGPINCNISGKMRKNFINILPGDRVKVAIPLVDPTRGRIVFRIR